MGPWSEYHVSECYLKEQYGGSVGILQMLTVLISATQSKTKTAMRDTPREKWMSENKKKVINCYFKIIST